MRNAVLDPAVVGADEGELAKSLRIVVAGNDQPSLP